MPVQQILLHSRQQVNKSEKQESIAVGCVPSAAVNVVGRGGVPPRGRTCREGVPAWGVYLPRGVLAWGRVPARGCTCLGVHPSMH